MSQHERERFCPEENREAIRTTYLEACLHIHRCTARNWVTSVGQRELRNSARAVPSGQNKADGPIRAFSKIRQGDFEVNWSLGPFETSRRSGSAFAVD